MNLSRLLPLAFVIGNELNTFAFTTCNRIVIRPVARHLSGAKGMTTPSPSEAYLNELSSAQSKATSRSDTSNTSGRNLGLDKDTRIQLLDDALRSNSTAATVLMDDIKKLRENGSPENVEEYVNTLLAVAPGKNVTDGDSLPWWTRIRPFARFSRRARRASLGRVLDLSTPSAEETESLGDDPLASKRRRRRSLLILLRSLAATTENDEEEGDSAPKKTRAVNILSLERAARKDAKANASVKDMDTRLPPGLETPKYTVLTRRPGAKGGYEVRRYDAFSVCSVPMSKPRPANSEMTDQILTNPQLSGASSFGALAGYLFGKNDQSTSMKMTTPVLTAGEGEQKEMSFVLPSSYWDVLDSAPKPLDGSLVRLQRDDGGDRAVIMFGGFAAKKEVEAKKKQLMEGLKKDPDWAVNEKDASFTLAQYNDPFTPPWKRRNEVSVPVVAKK